MRVRLSSTRIKAGIVESRRLQLKVLTSGIGASTRLQLSKALNRIRLRIKGGEKLLC